MRKLILLMMITFSAFATEIFWHRGDVGSAQENSMAAIDAALDSKHSNVEIDVISYRYFKKQLGVLAHDNKAGRITGLRGKIRDYDFRELENIADENLAPEPIISYQQFLDAMVERKSNGEKFQFIVDIKVRWLLGIRFSKFLAKEVKKRGLEDEALFLGWKRSTCKAVRKECKKCKIGIITKAPIFPKRKPKEKYLKKSKLDSSSLKDDYQFVVFKDTEYFQFPNVLKDWKKRGIKVAAYSSDMNQEYSEEQLELLKKLDFVVLDRKQIDQF